MISCAKYINTVGEFPFCFLFIAVSVCLSVVNSLLLFTFYICMRQAWICFVVRPIHRPLSLPSRIHGSDWLVGSAGFRVIDFIRLASIRNCFKTRRFQSRGDLALKRLVSIAGCFGHKECLLRRYTQETYILAICYRFY